MQQAEILKSDLIHLVEILPSKEIYLAKSFLEFLISKSKEHDSNPKNENKIDLSKWENIDLINVPKDCKFDRGFLYSDGDRGA
jgi:hypothetical protein